MTGRVARGVNRANSRGEFLTQAKRPDARTIGGNRTLGRDETGF
ncbi:MAG: hypothetical protein NT115_03535 [Proteobacteria bacterium]|nr:hypothetical protein [Pseudomonadota bacterium]